MKLKSKGDLELQQKFLFTIDLEPSFAYHQIKNFLTEQDFDVVEDSDAALENTELDGFKGILGAKTRRTLSAMIEGKAGEIQITVEGAKQQFTIEFQESGMLSGKKLKSDLWEKIVLLVDPSLWICESDGQIFRSKEEYDNHMQDHELRKLTTMNDLAQGGSANSW